MPHRRGHRQRPRPIRQESSDSTLPVYIKLKNTRNSKSENETLLKNKFNLHRVSNVNKKGLLQKVINISQLETIQNDPDVKTVFIDDEIETLDNDFQPSIVYSETSYQTKLRDNINHGEALSEYGVGEYSPLLIDSGNSTYPFDLSIKDKIILHDPPIHYPIQWINGTTDEHWGECWWRNPCIDNAPCTSVEQCEYNYWSYCRGNDSPSEENWAENNLFQCSTWQPLGMPVQTYHELATLSIMGSEGNLNGTCPTCKLGFVGGKYSEEDLVIPTEPYTFQPYNMFVNISHTDKFIRAIENAIEYKAVAINFSWGTTSGDMSSATLEQIEARREFWQSLVDDAWDNNIIIAASAGNNESMSDNDIKCDPNPLITFEDGSTMYAQDCYNITDEQECESLEYDYTAGIFYGPCRWQSNIGCYVHSSFKAARYPMCLEKVIMVQGSDGQSNYGTEEILTDQFGIYTVSAPMKSHKFAVPRNDIGLHTTSGNGYDFRTEITHKPYTNSGRGGVNFDLQWVGDYSGEYYIQPSQVYDEDTAHHLIYEYMWFLDESDYFEFQPNPQAVSNIGNGSGTSYGTPMVTGLVGLLRAHNPDLTSEQTIEIILNGRHEVTYPLCDGVNDYANTFPVPSETEYQYGCTQTRVPEIDVKFALDYLYAYYPPPEIPINPIPDSWNYIVPNMLEGVGYTGNDWFIPSEYEDIIGCIDSSACNYNSEATIDDDSCTYPAETYLNCEGSCINDYDGDGICDEVEIPGCTDSDACNYNPVATDDNGTCTYPAETYLNCEGSCINDYDGDGICDEEEVYGCTDSSACNYNSEATTDDGNCWYVEGVCDCNGNIPEGVCNCEGDTSEIICGDVNRDCDCVCFNDIDNDNICDEEDLCIEQGGISQECGCNTPIPNGDCDCNGNTLDECGICGGDGFQVECWNGDLVCDESECNNIPGDANFSGHLSVADLVIISQQIIQSSDSGLTPEEIYQQYPEMDFSGNGRVSVQDLVQMIQYMLYGSEVTVSSTESQQLQEIQRQLDRLGDDSGTAT